MANSDFLWMEDVVAKESMRIRLGQLYVDQVTLPQALQRMGHLIKTGQGGTVVTPNVDHLCLAELSPPLVQAYQRASLALADGMPLLWLARAMGHPLPEKISGSDLIAPLCAWMEQQQLRLFLFGAQPGVGQAAAEVLARQYPQLKLVGHYAPPLGFEKHPEQRAQAIAVVQQAKPDVVLVALGCPKQELWMDEVASHWRPAILLGVGASLDFIAGRVQRAPRWMSQSGLEWLYRLWMEPKRMAERYLVRDRAIVRIAWQTLRLPREQRTFPYRVSS